MSEPIKREFSRDGLIDVPGKIYREIDGEYVWLPPNTGGSYTAANLRRIIGELEGRKHLVFLGPECTNCGRSMRETPKSWTCTICGHREGKRQQRHSCPTPRISTMNDSSNECVLDSMVRWVVLFRSRNKLNGYRQYIVRDNGQWKTFITRKAARKWAREQFGYISRRDDLRREPHGWMPPRLCE